jgi:signal peptidase II
VTSVAQRAAGLSLPHAPGLPVQVGLLTAAIFIVLDQATKELAETLLDHSVFVPLFGDAVGWQLVYNPGGAFGLPAPAWLFIIVTIAVTVIVARTLPQTHSVLQATAYGLLLAGALGNAIDRLLRPSTTGRQGWFDGEVVDFVAWGSFPRFNVADSAITVGFVVLLVALWQEERRLQAHGAEVDTDAEGTAGVANGTGASDGVDASDGGTAADDVDAADGAGAAPDDR